MNSTAQIRKHLDKARGKGKDKHSALCSLLEYAGYIWKKKKAGAHFIYYLSDEHPRGVLAEAEQRGIDQITLAKHRHKNQVHPKALKRVFQCVETLCDIRET